MRARLLLISSLLVLAVTAPAQPTRLGDLDADGRATVLDLVRLLGHVNGTNRLSAALTPYGDINEDGMVNTNDVILLQNAILELYSLPNPFSAPVVTVPIAATNGTNLVLTGLARPNRQIIVEGGLVRIIGSADSNGNFTVNVPLQPNRLNNLYVTATNSLGSGAPTVLHILQDSQPPSLFIDAPADSSDLTSSNVVVAGRVGDMLSGFMGLNVFVTNLSVQPPTGGPANVNVGIGNNGTFEQLVPLANGTNLLTATASDVHGNAITKQILVRRIPLSGPRLFVVSGDRQTTNIHRRLADPIVVRVTQSDGVTPFPNKLVTFEVTRSDGRLVTDPDSFSTTAMRAQVFTDINGLAFAWWTLGGDAGCGNNRVCATSRDIAGSAFFCASANPAPAQQINVGSGNNQRAEAGAPAPEALRAWVSDSCNGVSRVPVLFTVVAGGGKVNGQNSITNETSITGHAQVNFTLGPDGGNNIVEATFPGHAGLPATFILQGVRRDPSQPTSFSGLVFDNANCSIGGAHCVFQVGGMTFITYSDVSGRYSFTNIPAGPGHLHVDGLTATNLAGQPIPQGSYPALAYTPVIVPNAANSLPMPVLLPKLNPANARLYYGTNDVELTCEGMAGLKMIVHAGSMRRPDGSVPTPQDPAIVALNQVHHDDIPMPMPDGASPPFAWTLQPGGATFGPPISIEYPNMSALPAGAIAYFLSFNHETERFEIVASGHVKEDSATIVTDAGAGLAVAGWGCNCPPYSATCDVENCPASAAPPGAPSPPPGTTNCCTIALTGAAVLSTNRALMITVTGGQVTWEVVQPGGQVTFTMTPTSITLRGHAASQMRDDVIVRAKSMKDRSCIKEHRVTVVTASFKASAPCCGFDDTLTPPWLMAPVGGMNTAQLEIQPPDAVSLVELSSSLTSLATVAPTVPAASPQTVTVTGVAKGAPEIRATLKETGEPIARLGVSLKEQLVKLVLIHRITEPNQNLVPTMVPSETDLENYLNDTIWGKQANVYCVVIRNDHTIPYDLNSNGVCDVGIPVPNQLSPEERAIVNGVGETNADVNVYFVQSYAVAGNAVNASTMGRLTFIQDSHPNSALNITAHEIGHGLGVHTESARIQDIMFFTSSSNNPCRVTKHDWDLINP